MKDPSHLGACQNYGPFLVTLNFRCRNIRGIQKGTIILTTTLLSAVDVGSYSMTPTSGTCRLGCVSLGSGNEKH